MFRVKLLAYPESLFFDINVANVSLNTKLLGKIR